MNSAPSKPLLHIAKRRIPVTVALTTSERIDGHLYADVERLDGGRASLLDVLTNPLETHLPLATSQQHVLVSKSHVLTIEVSSEEIARPAATTVRRLALELILSTGERLSGNVYAMLPPARRRTLDFLTCNREPFITLFGGERVILVNFSHIATVVEHSELAQETET